MSRGRTSPILLFVIAIVLLPVVYSVFSTGVSLAYLTLPVLAFCSIGWFVWRVFLRIYLRATRISHARERRLLLEASQRE
jgi:hypothetical protein